MVSSIRKAIARLMTESKQQIPHYYLTMRPEMSAMLDRREEWNAAHAKEESISVNDLIVKAVAMALAAHPEFNAFYRNDAMEPQEAINVGVAIALDEGLIAPAILNADTLSLPEIGKRSRDLRERAHNGKIKPDEFGTATFTISNLGMFGVDSFVAIVVPPQVGILAVGTVTEMLATREGEIITERRIGLTLSADHRATDGAEGARFLGDIVAWLQNPDDLFA